MPWVTPALSQVRANNRDYIASRLLLPLIPNSDTRVLADAGGGMAHGCRSMLIGLRCSFFQIQPSRNGWIGKQTSG
jgi:hypothetical protein